jgi:hypothetical protein
MNFSTPMFFQGIDELGIYRVSGVSSDVKRLKEKFDESKFVDTLWIHICHVFRKSTKIAKHR